MTNNEKLIKQKINLKMDRESEQTLCKEDIEMANRHGKIFHTANY